MSKTIKQLADEIGVSKTAIRKRLTPEFRKNYVETTENGVLVITEIGCGKIAETLKTSANKFVETPQTTENSLTVTALLEQLQMKDKQIEALNDALKKAQQLTDQAQQLQAAAEHKVAQLEAPKRRRWSFWKQNKEQNDERP